MNPLRSLRSRPLSQEKANVLLLLTACALVLAPHAAHLPLWAPPACAALLLWRAWLTLRGNPMPSRWLMLPCAALVAAGVFWTYRTFLGREAGVTLLALLLSLKLLEMHAKRDLSVVIFLSFFLLLASFFYSQSIGSAAYAIVALIALLSTQLSFQYTGAAPPLMRRLRSGITIVALAVPVTLVLFLLFPRIQGPLWRLPGDAGSGHTGMSDSMAPGNIARLAQSDDIAFRARFTGPPPPSPNRYWRGIVLGRYDGRTWTPLPAVPAHARLLTVRWHGAPVRYQVTLEPTGQHWLFTLELASAPPHLAGDFASFTRDFELTSIQPINQRIRYEAESTIEAELQPDASPQALQPWLALPAGFNPQTLALANRLRTEQQEPDRIIGAVLQMFRNQPFRYTLEPPLLGRNAIDEFLFSTRAGFCEHYASAFVVLMRAAGIPARVVTGYQGGEINPVDGYMIVRQSDAHAWAEVWLQGRGWTRIDPTAAVAPERIERSLSSLMPQRFLGGLVHIDLGSGNWLGGLRLRWDALTNLWNQRVLNYSSDTQQHLMQKLGFRQPGWSTLIGLLFACGSLALAVVAIPLLRNRTPRDPVNICYQRFCELLARDGIVRAPHEGPRALAARATAGRSPLSSQRKHAVLRFLQMYETIQYGERDAADRSRALSELKFLLSECR